MLFIFLTQLDETHTDFDNFKYDIDAVKRMVFGLVRIFFLSLIIVQLTNSSTNIEEKHHLFFFFFSLYCSEEESKLKCHTGMSLICFLL